VRCMQRAKRASKSKLASDPKADQYWHSQLTQFSTSQQTAETALSRALEQHQHQPVSVARPSVNRTRPSQSRSSDGQSKDKLHPGNRGGVHIIGLDSFMVLLLLVGLGCALLKAFLDKEQREREEREEQEEQAQALSDAAWGASFRWGDGQVALGARPRRGEHLRVVAGAVIIRVRVEIMGSITIRTD
jgi:hypothetical protein